MATNHLKQCPYLAVASPDVIPDSAAAPVGPAISAKPRYPVARNPAGLLQVSTFDMQVIFRLVMFPHYRVDGGEGAARRRRSRSRLRNYLHHTSRSRGKETTYPIDRRRE